MKPRLLLTGGSGFLGSHFIPLVANQWDIHCIVNKNDPASDITIPHKINLNNYNELEQQIRLLKPDYIIHFAANANANYCEQFPWNSWKINVEASFHLAKIAAHEDIPFAFTSTDLVFDGGKGNYIEEDFTKPINKYGAQKVEAENLILRYNPNAIIFRLPLMFGKKEFSESNYLSQMIAKLKRREVVSLFTDEYRSVCGASSIAKGIIKLMHSAKGIIHLGGPEKLSRYEFGVMAAKIMGCETTLINGCKQQDVQMAAPRPKDVSLNSSKAIYLGYRPLSPEEELRLIANGGTLN